MNTIHEALPMPIRNFILEAQKEPVTDMPGVRQVLTRAYEHNFADPELAEETGENVRALVHAAFSRLDSQVVLRRKNVERILNLDDANLMVRKVNAVGWKTKLFGELTERMNSDLQAGKMIWFEGQSYDYHWNLKKAGKSGVMIPAWALENLTRFRMAGGQYDDVLLGEEIIHPRIEYQAPSYPDPVLLVRFPGSMFLIEIARWV